MCHFTHLGHCCVLGCLLQFEALGGLVWGMIEVSGWEWGAGRAWAVLPRKVKWLVQPTAAVGFGRWLVFGTLGGM